MIINIDSTNIRVYKYLIEYETNQKITWSSTGEIYLDSMPICNYQFVNNYYFVAGDYVKDSIDSRYWGLLPEEHILGKALIILYGRNTKSDKINWKRLFKRLT